VNAPIEPQTHSLAALPPALALEVDELCDDFERLWRRARQRGESLPQPDVFVKRVSELARRALAAALEVLHRELLAESAWPGIPGYTFLQEIARGPMGVVYRVRAADGRELALKTIQSAELVCWSRCLRLRAEGEVLTELRHPHIVPVESFGEHEGLQYLVMPLVAGGDLRKRLDEFYLMHGGIERAARIRGLMGKVAGAVAFLHQCGILHRDICDGSGLGWLRNPLNENRDQRRAFEPLRRSNLRTARGWAMKETLMGLRGRNVLAEVVRLGDSEPPDAVQTVGTHVAEPTADAGELVQMADYQRDHGGVELEDSVPLGASIAAQVR